MTDNMQRAREPKFGDWIRGIYASESNPRRDGMYVRTIHRKGRMNPGKFYELTDGNGAFWMYPAQSVERIAAALRSAQVPEGWVLVPLDAVTAAATELTFADCEGAAADLLNAMLAAAPKPEDS